METEGRFVGLVGLGYWGGNILRNLSELGVLHTACDSDPMILSDQKKQFPNASYTTAIKDVLENPDIKAVVIATPAATHYEFVKKAILKDKDVFVEKPLALTAKEGEELVELASKKERILMVGHILQYHPAIIKLKELISSGKLGKIQYIYSNRLNIGKLRVEENILWSFAPHDISVILMLLDEDSAKVTAFGEASLNKDIYDTTMTTLEFRSGVKGHIFVSWLHPYKEQKLIVVGSEAMVVFNDMSEEKLFLYPHKIEWKHGKVPVAQRAAHKVIPVQKEEALKNELRHFVECVRRRKRPRTDGLEGLRVLRILESAESGLLKHRGSVTERPAPSHFVHESSYIDDGVKIGEGTKIWHFSHILGGSVIGKGCTIGQNVSIGPDVTLGDRCKIQNNVSIYKGVVLEDEVFCGPSCVFTNVYSPRAFIERKHEFMPTLVKKGATIGANSTIVCGTTLGKYSTIGAGAVVKSDVTDFAIVAGVPAKQIGWACQCGSPLKPNKKKALCMSCGSQYRLDGNRLTPTEGTANP